VTPSALIRIGELSRRTGVTIDRLRAWERRYGLLNPARSDGGFRLYSPSDQRRVRAMLEQLTAGVSAAEAAAAVLASNPAGAARPSESWQPRRHELTNALTDFDAARAHALLDSAFADLGSDQAIAEVVFPALRVIGERWALADVHVGQEHFASTLIEGRMLALLRADEEPAGPAALLACAPGELHALGLIALGIALRGRGWSVTYLGADTPVADVRRTAARLSPAMTVLAAVIPGRFTGVLRELGDLARDVPLAIAGPGASRALADRVGARLLDDDPFTAAEKLARAAQGQRSDG